MADPRHRWAETPSLVALRQATNAAARVRPVVAHVARLSHSELVALEHLTSGPVGPAELARLLEVTTAASTGIVDRLEARGHVARVADPHDRRRTSVHLTDSGRAEVVGLLQPMVRALQQLDAGFDDDEREVVARYLDGARAAFETVAGPAPER
jgi:DNA-binding MarR family transcriptional regulator